MQNDAFPTAPNPNPNPAPTPTTPPNPASGLGAAAVNATVASEMLTPSVVEPASSATPAAFGPSAPGTAPAMQATAPLVSAGTSAPAQPDRRNLIETIILVAVSLVAVVFIGLFIWKYLDWYNAKTDVDAQIDNAVAIAVSENTTKLNAEFEENKKYPYKTFSGPVDYGSVSFQYPKTWNVYIAKDAVNGGNYEAYLNPGEVLPVGNTTINALRFTIQDKAFDTVAKSYESAVKSGKLSMVTRNVGSAMANVYTGDISTNIRDIVTIFKVRDKTVLIQTDSELFAEEYYKLLDTVNFVE